MAGLSPQITNLLIMLFFFQASKQIPFDNPDVLNGVRALYLVSNAIIFGITLYIQSKIKAKNDLTTMKYVTPPPMGSQEDPKLVTTTIKEYDLQQTSSAVKGQLMGIAMMGFMHLYMKYTNPLLLQSVLPLKSALETPIAKIHLWGSPASGDLKRPFKQAGGMMAGLTGGANEVKTDKAAIEAAERAGRGGAKEE